MNVSYKPTLWKHLQWKDPISSFYFKQDKVSVSSKKDTYPVLDQSRTYVKHYKSCVYSGSLLTKRKVIDGLLSDSLTSMLCGLPYDVFDTSLNEIFKLFKLTDKTSDYIELYSLFKQYRTSILSENYHYVCPQWKQTRQCIDFLHMDFNSLQLSHLDYYQDNLKKFLYEIFERKPRHTKQHRSQYILEMYEDIRKRLTYFQQVFQFYQKDISRLICISLVVSLHTYLVVMNIVPISLSDMVLKLDDIQTIQYYDDTNLSDSVIREETGFSDPDSYIFVRSYLNLIQTIKSCINPSQSHYSPAFRKNAINVSNYIWNVWSKRHGIQEAILQGDSESIDTMNQGPQDDSWVRKHPYILFQKLNEYLSQKISTSLSESAVKSDATDTTDTTTLDDNQEDTMKQDLQRMEFKLNQQPLSFQ